MMRKGRRRRRSFTGIGSELAPPRRGLEMGDAAELFSRVLGGEGLGERNEREIRGRERERGVEEVRW